LTELRESILKEVTELRKKGEESEPTETYPEIKNATFELYQSLTRLSSIITTMPRENIILQSIQFSSIKARVESMESAADGSFNWMFKDENEADKEPVSDAISSLGLKEDECEALSHSEEKFHKHNCMRREELLHDRNLDTSHPSCSRDLAPPLLRLAQARLSFGSCLLRSAHPSHQTSSTFNEGPEMAPFPSQGSQSCSHCTFIACPVCRLHEKCPHAGDIFLRLTSGCLTSFSAVCLGLRAI
jgi:hypothetical protein